MPEGIWECPRHRCISCGSGPSQTDANGKPRVPGAQAAHTQQWRSYTASPPKCHLSLLSSHTHFSHRISAPLPIATPNTDTDTASTLWPCRTCPTTYCERCLPEEISFAGDEIVCEECQEVLVSDVTTLQRDLIKWKPELFAK